MPGLAHGLGKSFVERGEGVRTLGLVEFRIQDNRAPLEIDLGHAIALAEERGAFGRREEAVAKLAEPLQAPLGALGRVAGKREFAQGVAEAQVLVQELRRLSRRQGGQGASERPDDAVAEHRLRLLAACRQEVIEELEQTRSGQQAPGCVYGETPVDFTSPQ